MLNQILELNFNIMDNSLNNLFDYNINLAQVFDNNIDKGFEFVDYASSVNISCTMSVQNPLAIKNAVEYCKFKSKEIGALISLPASVTDPLSLSSEEVEAIVLYQLGAISSFTKAASLNIEHVRPCGLMYKTAAQNLEFSLAVANAVKKYSEWLVLYGAAGNVIKETETTANINIAQEILINGVYAADMSVDFSSGLISDKDLLDRRLNGLIKQSELYINNNESFKVECDTIHFDVDYGYTLDLIKEAHNTVEPRPVNYNKVVASGWVE